MIKQINTSVVFKFLNPLNKEVINMKRMTPLLFIMIFPLLSVLVSALTTTASEEVEIIALIETANSPEDHIKIAEFYEKQAENMEKKANKHTVMGNAYKNRSKPWPSMVKNCANLANKYRAIAEEYNALEVEHRKMAEQLQNQ